MPSGIFQSFIPWIIYFIIESPHYLSSDIAASSALIATIIFSYKNLKKKYVLDWGTLLYFLFLSIVFFLPNTAWIKPYAFLLSNSILALIMWVSIFIRRPFTIQYAKEEVEEIYWITPTFRHINYTISLIWALALTLMAVDGFLQEFKMIKSDLIADAIIVALILTAIGLTRWFPDWYQGFLFRKMSKSKEDTSKNPDHLMDDSIEHLYNFNRYL